MGSGKDIHRVDLKLSDLGDNFLYIMYPCRTITIRAGPLGGEGDLACLDCGEVHDATLQPPSQVRDEPGQVR